MEATNNVDWVALEEVTRLAVRFLDNVQEVSELPLEDINETSKGLRRLGLGPAMGWADLLAELGLAYDSEEAFKLGEYISWFISFFAWQESIELAREVGPFKYYDKYKVNLDVVERTLNSKFSPGKFDMDEVRKVGVRNVSVTAIAPTGCQKGDTLVTTSDGIFELNELGDTNGNEWQDIDIEVSQEFEYQKATKFFVNGTKETRRIKLNSGIDLECTPNHKYRVISDNKYIWKIADTIAIGDLFVVPLNTYNNTKDNELIPVNNGHGNETKCELPTKVTPDLAKFLGIFFGDGSVHDAGIRLSFNSEENDYTYVAELGESLFKFKPTISFDKRMNGVSVCFSSTKLLRWLAANDFIKNKAKDIVFPKSIRKFNRVNLNAFLEGFYFADGSKSNSARYIDTASHKFSKQWVVISRALGRECRIYEHQSGLGSKIYRVVWVRNHRKCETDETRRLLDSLALSNCTVDVVTEIEKSECPTFDLEVPNNNCYISNGVMSHNSISLVAGVNSGIEPFFALAYRRHITEGVGNLAKDTIVEINPILFRKLKKLNLSDEDMKEVTEHVLKYGTIQDCAKIPGDIRVAFKTAHDLTWQAHLEMQARWQTYVSNSVSKCIAKGTLIQTNFGIIPIEDLGLARGDDVFSDPLAGLMVLDESGNWKKVTKHYSGGYKKTIKVRTDLGFILEGSESHKIMTDSGWKKLSELLIGDLVLNRRRNIDDIELVGGLPIEQEKLYHNGKGLNKIIFPQKMSVEFAKLLGMLCADGCTIESSGNTELTTADDLVEETFTDLSYKVFGVRPHISKDFRTKNTRGLIVRSRPLARMIEKLIGKGCRNKRMPEQILKGSIDEMKAFIEGVTLDGYICHVGNNKTIPRRQVLCIYEGYSKELVYQIFSCLNRMGTVPYINRKNVYYNNEFREKAYGIFIDENIINPIEDHKKLPLTHKKRLVMSSIVLPDIDKNSFLFNQLGKLRRYTGIILNTTCDKYLIPYDHELTYSKVTDIESSNAELYDIEVEDSHTYLINGMVSHNTINLSNDATEQDVYDCFLEAWKKGVKGLTVFRNNSRMFQVLNIGVEGNPAP